MNILFIIAYIINLTSPIPIPRDGILVLIPTPEWLIVSEAEHSVVMQIILPQKDVDTDYTADLSNVGFFTIYEVGDPYDMEMLHELIDIWILKATYLPPCLKAPCTNFVYAIMVPGADGRYEVAEEGNILIPQLSPGEALTA